MNSNAKSVSIRVIGVIGVQNIFEHLRVSAFKKSYKMSNYSPSLF